MYAFNESAKQRDLLIQSTRDSYVIPTKGHKTDLEHAMNKCYAYHVTRPRVTPW